MDGKINDEIYTWGQSMRGEGNRKWENSVENWKMEKKNKKRGFVKGRKIKSPGKVRKKKNPVLCPRCEFFDSDHPIVSGGHFYIPTR